MKKILFLIIGLFIFLISCKEEYTLYLDEQYLNIELFEGEEFILPVEYSENARLIGYSSNDNIASYEKLIIKGNNEGECEVTLRLDEDASLKYIIKVKVVKKYYLNSDVLNYNIKIGASAKLVYNTNCNDDVIFQVLDPSICIIEDGYIKGINEGGTKIKVFLKDDFEESFEIIVYVLPLYNSYYNFNLGIFEEVEIIQKESNKKVVLDEELKQNFIERVRLIYFIDNDDDFSSLELLYTINCNDNVIKVYEGDYFTFNDKKKIIISLDYYEEKIDNFDFLGEYKYTETVNSGWFPWV